MGVLPISIENVCVVGLGKLGSPLAAALAYKGFQVIGLDVSPSFVNQINNGIAPVPETRLQEMIDQSGGRLRATTDYAEAIMSSQAALVIVPTPSADDGTFILDYVHKSAEAIGRLLAQKEDYFLYVIVSTVMPGDTEMIKQTLETYSGKVCGQDFGVCYSPEFIALGSVVRDLLNPDMLLLGESDPVAGVTYEQMLLKLVDNTPPVMRMNFINAEITKLAVNTYVTTKITYANMLARMCENIPGADVDTVTSALGMDTRIGKKYLKGAVPYGGPCFPRDNIAFAKVAERAQVTAPIAVATHQYNLDQNDLLADFIINRLPGGSTITILGLSYKPQTPVVEESASLYFIQALLRRQVPVTVFDPMAMENTQKILGDTVSYAETLEDAIKRGNAFVIMTAWDDFKRISPELLRRANGERPIIVDAWRVLSADEYSNVADIITLGRSPVVEGVLAI